jgi:adenylate cyclase
VAGSELKQRLAAIFAADAAGYSRLMAADERGTVAALDAARAVFRKHLESHRGRVIDMAGDSVLAIFDLATAALSGALAIQAELSAGMERVPEDRRMRFRIGVHIGEIIEKVDGTIYGDGVNIAARLQALANPGGIAVSDAVRGSVKNRVAAMFEDLGEQKFKNIADAVRAYRIKPAEAIADATAIAREVVSLSAPVPGFGGRPAIAVLPFANLSGDPEQEYFADGLAEDILTRLAMWRWVPVIARNSSFTFKDRAVDVREIGRALGARYVLEGSVRKADDRVRVTGQLIDAQTGHHLWAERYDRKLENVFAIQDELTEGIANALESAIDKAELERARFKPPANLDAWDAWQRARWHATRITREDFATSERFFHRAIELDPGMAPPFSDMAFVRACEGFFMWRNPASAFGDAAKYARTALDLDPMESMACAVLAAVLGFTGALDEAVALGRKSIALNPSNPSAYFALCTVHLWRGEAKEGIEVGESSIRISPNDTLLHMFLGVLSGNYYIARNYAQSLHIARLAVQRAPHYPPGWRTLANALAQLGRIDEARQALADFLKLMPGFTSEATARASLGFRDEALLQHYLEGLRKAGWQG